VITTGDPAVGKDAWWLKNKRARSEAEVGANGSFQAHQLAWVKPSAMTPQPGFVDRVQVCGVDEADIVAREARFAVQGYVGLGRPPSSGHDGHCHGAQARDHHVDRQYDDRVIADPGKMSVPDIASQRLHRLVGVCCHHSCGQRGRSPVVKLVVSCGEVHLARTPVKQAQALPYQL
jgi:hypothetical protein